MLPSNDDLADYRARAAACRAKAAKAAEHQQEARTWLETAAMWDGLADRIERSAAAWPPPADAGADATRMARPEVDLAARYEDEAGAERPLAEPPLAERPLAERPQQPAVAPPGWRPEAARRARRLRVAALAGFLLLLALLASAALWPRTDERAGTVAERSGSAGTTAVEPQAAVADAARPAEERGVPPTQAAPIATAAPPVEKSAAMPSSPDLVPVRPEPPRPEVGSETTGVGQGPEPDPQSAVPEPSDAGPSRPQPAQPVPETPTAPPSEPRPDSATPRDKLTGTWWPNPCPKPAERKTAVPMVLGEDRARAGTASCTFLKKTQAGNAWSIVAKCSDASSSWTAHIRLVLNGKRLSWASERGTQTYLRCP